VLATMSATGRPDLVPCCFALDGVRWYSAIDDKPKTTVRLQRLENVSADARVTLLFDSYSEDWERLWWVRAAGRARVLDDGSERDDAVALLLAKYPQYRTHALDGPVVAAALERWQAWAAHP
jgi:PPOX class probable F420-dependent enzyme